MLTACCQHEHRYLTESNILTHTSQQLDAAHIRQHPVQQDQIKGVISHDFPGSFTVTNRSRIKVSAFQCIDQQAGDIGIVFNNQQPDSCLTAAPGLFIVVFLRGYRSRDTRFSCGIHIPVHLSCHRSSMMVILKHKCDSTIIATLDNR